MAVSDQNRKLFEGVGKRAIQRELIIGGIQYLGIGDSKRREAQEWVDEQEIEEAKARKVKAETEHRRFAVIRWWTVIAAIASVVAAATGIMALFR